MIKKFDSMDQLITGQNIQKLQSIIKEKLNKERARILRVKGDDSKYVGAFNVKKPDEMNKDPILGNITLETKPQ